VNVIKAMVALAAGIALLGSSAGIAQVAVPPLSARVTDQTGTLTNTQTDTLKQTLQAFESKKGTQIAVLIVPSTAPETIEQYSLRVAEQWKLGRKKVDDGALLIVAKNDRTLRIEVGYGLEGALNDAISKRIISETIVPQFRANDFYGGIKAGIEQMIRVADGEPLPPPQAQTSDGDSSAIGKLIPVIFILAVVFGKILRILFGRLPGAAVAGGLVALIAWLLTTGVVATVAAGVITFLYTLINAGIGGYVGTYGSSGRGGGRGGGGGFGGGGGGFGGGGASGRW